MRRLYSARVARPLSSSNTRPTRLGYSITAWCPHEDLIAVISGCGAVAVFHADAPGEAAQLVGNKRSPARHVIWRNSQEKALMLVVVDASGRITFWMSRDRRVNIWYVASYVDVPSVVISIGWNAASTALAAILAHGTLFVWQVPEYPATDLRHRPKLHNQQQPRPPADIKPANQIRELNCRSSELTDRFGGPLTCGTVAPGHVDPYSVAVATVSVANPNRLFVWHVSLTKENTPGFDVGLIAATDMPESSSCVACSAVPKSGMLFAISDRGLIARWHLRGAGTNADRGWQLQAHAQITSQTNAAVERGILSKSEISVPTDANSRGIEASRQRKVFAFEISSDCQSMVTSTSAGLLLWDAQTLKIVAGHRIDSAIRPSLSQDSPSPYWGLCISPLGAAAFALNGRGTVDAFSLKPPIIRPVSESSAPTIAKQLLIIPHPEGLRGGWDLIASIASEGPEAAKLVDSALQNITPRTNPNSTPEKNEAVRRLMSRIIHAEDASAAVARNLLELATEAIRHSAPEIVKLKLSVSAKDAKMLTSPANITRFSRHMLSSTRVSSTQLVAAPLADWIMVLCAVWLQRCAEILSKHDPKGERMGVPWVNVVAMSSRNEKNIGPNHGIVYDTMLARMLRPASFCALLLLALEEENREPEAMPRYFRFPSQEAPCIVAAFWEVSLAWESVDVLSRNVASGGGAPNPLHSSQLIEKMGSTALVLAKHLAAAKTLANAPELRIGAAEKALGLHGAAKGAGFIMSRTRMHHGANGPGGFGDDSTNNGVNLRAEWCQHDIVTGRPLPPWAPLRRCIISGLLSVEITQQKSDAPQVNMASPWISKWAYESPFGGRWARVPSLDLDRYELLQPVHQVTADNSHNVSNVTGRNVTVEDADVPSRAQVAPPFPRAPPHVGPPNEGELSVDPNSAKSAAAAAVAAVAIGTDPSAHPSAPNSIPVQQGGSGSNINGSVQFPVGVGVNGSPMIPAPMQGMSGRPHPSPTVSTATETGKRKPGRLPARRPPLKKTALEPRTPTSAQHSEYSGLSVPGMQNSSSPANVMGVNRPIAPDTMSQDSTATNTTGRKKPTKKMHQRQLQQQHLQQFQQQQQQHQQANGVQPFASPGASVNIAGSIDPQTGMNTGVQQNLGMFNQPAFQQGLAAVNRPNMVRKQSPMMKNPNPSTAAAAAVAGAAAAAAAATATNRPIDRNNPGLQDGGLPNALGLGMVTGADNISQLGMIDQNLASNGMGGAKLPINISKRNMGPIGMSQDFNLVSAGMGTGNSGLSTSNGLPGGDFNSFSASGIGLSPGAHQPGINNVSPVQHQVNGNGGQMEIEQLAITFGVKPQDLSNIPPEKAQPAIDALSRRAELTHAAMNGTGGMSVGVGNEMNMMNNGAMMGPGAMNGMDAMGNISTNSNINTNGSVNSNGMVGNVIGGVGGGMGSSPAGNGADMGLGNGQGRNMVGGDANGMMAMNIGMNIGMGNVRTSAAESVSSVRSRLGNNNFDTLQNVGMPGMGMGDVDQDGLSMGMVGADMNLSSGNLDGAIGLNGGVNVNGNNFEPPYGGVGNNSSNNGGVGPNNDGLVGDGGVSNTDGRNDGEQMNEGIKVWQGHIRALGDHEELNIPCLAMRTNLSYKPIITDVSAWPVCLDCSESSRVRDQKGLGDQVNVQGAQWFVRFVLPNGPSPENQRNFNELVKQLDEKGYGFAIPCRENSGTPGTLFIWSIKIQGIRMPSLLGVYKPENLLQPGVPVPLTPQQPTPPPPQQQQPPQNTNHGFGLNASGDLGASDNGMQFMMMK